MGETVDRRIPDLGFNRVARRRILAKAVEGYWNTKCLIMIS